MPQPRALDEAGAGAAGHPAAGGRRWTRLGVVLAIVAGIHIAILATLALQSGPRPPSPDHAAIQVMLACGVAGLSTARPPPAAAPTPAASPTASPIGTSPPVPAGAAETPSPVPSVPAPAVSRAAEVAEQQGSAPAGGTGGCDLETEIQARLSSDTAVLSALQSLPANAKSVANAVELWNGAWIAPEPGVPDPLAPARAAVLQTIAAARQDCRFQLVQGPRLILVEAGDQTYVVSVGSGSWRWNDLTTPYPMMAPPK